MVCLLDDLPRSQCPFEEWMSLLAACDDHKQ